MLLGGRVLPQIGQEKIDMRKIGVEPENVTALWLRNKVAWVVCSAPMPFGKLLYVAHITLTSTLLHMALMEEWRERERETWLHK